MRVVQVVSALSPDNRFGGPSRVAIDLTRGLRQRGHEVVVAAAAVDYRILPRRVAGAPAALVRGFNPTPFLGWASLLAPGLSRRLAQQLRRAELVHIHLARDVVTLSAGLAARRRRVPYIVQTHGMVDAPERRLARIVDAMATRRVLRGAARVLVLTPDERETALRAGVPEDRIRVLRNGVEHVEPDAAAHAGPVLFLARLHPRKGAAAFAAAATVIAGRRPAERFSIVGPDEGDADRVDRLISEATDDVRARVVREGGVSEVEARRRLAAARIVVLPAAREPFGMALVEAMAAGRPVIVADDAELADDIRASGSGWTFGPRSDHRTLVDVIEAALDDDVEARGRRALRLVETTFDLQRVLDELVAMYADVVSTSSPGGASSKAKRR